MKTGIFTPAELAQTLRKHPPTMDDMDFTAMIELRAEIPKLSNDQMLERYRGGKTRPELLADLEWERDRNAAAIYFLNDMLAERGL